MTARWTAHHEEIVADAIVDANGTEDLERAARSVLRALTDRGWLPYPLDPYAPADGERCGVSDPNDETLSCHRSPMHAPHAVDNIEGRHIWLDAYAEQVRHGRGLNNQDGLTEMLADVRARFDRIAQAHTKDVDERYGTPDCIECGHAWPCPTYVWVTSEASGEVQP